MTRPRPGSRRVPRTLHPLAWWAWALGLATATSRTTNPLLLGLVAGVLALVVSSRRGDAPWARALKYYLGLGLAVIAVRVTLRALFGGEAGASGQHVIVSLPRIPLPSWAAGVQIGGPVTAEAVLSALYDGLLLACLLCCIGAANVLANPRRAVRVLPRALYELGAAVVVSVNIAPQLIESGQRARRAQRLRGNDARGVRALRTVAIPVLEDALERSIHLAAAMDSRGYGRSAAAPIGARRLTAVCLLGGVIGLCIGAYVLLTSTGGVWGVALAFGGGAAACCAGLALGGRRVRRSCYRPDPWRWPEWAVAISGIVPAVVLVFGIGFPAASLNPSTDPPTWPTLPLVPAVAILVASLAAVAAPPPVRRSPAGADSGTGAGRPGPAHRAKQIVGAGT
jgi:energy-coupling factor transport system permease protein